MPADTTPWKPGATNRPRGGLPQEHLRRQVFEQGTKVGWSIRLPCPCTQVESYGTKSGVTEEVRTDCPECGGSGSLYGPETEIYAIVQSAQNNPLFMQSYGDRAVGGARFTVLPEHAPGDRDRLRMASSTHLYKEEFVSNGVLDELTYPIAQPTLRLSDISDQSVEIQTTRGVYYLRAADATGVPTATDYIEGTHFDITDGKVDWSGGSSPAPPADGIRLSIAYRANPVYIVRGAPHTHRQTIEFVKDCETGVVTEVHRDVTVAFDAWLESYDTDKKPVR